MFKYILTRLIHIESTLHRCRTLGISRNFRHYANVNWQHAQPEASDEIPPPSNGVHGGSKDGNECEKLPPRPPKPPPPRPPSSSKRMPYMLGIIFSGLCTLLLWAIYELGKPDVDQNGQAIEDELSALPQPEQYLKRMWRSLQYYQKMLEEPVPAKLLPDVLQPPYIQAPYTLVLEMKDVLVHPDWSYQTGWRFKKRPGVDYLLQQCSRHFEIVVYTSEQGTTVFPILDALDPHGFIRYRLVRSATQFIDGHHIKNLDWLNRNLKRVIIVDWDRNATRLHPDNAFAMSRWLGNDDDVQLFDLVAFLQIIADNEMDDVREVLHYYRQFEDPIEQFKENQRKLLEHTEQMQAGQTKSRGQNWLHRFRGC